MSTTTRLLPALLAALVAAALLPGCTPAVEQPRPTGGERIAAGFGALVEQHLARDDLSEFEREVLERARETGEIAAEDYETAHAREAACLADAGFDVEHEKLANGLYASTPRLAHVADNAERGRLVDAYMAATVRCGEGVSIVIESLYTLQQGNPDLLADQDEAAVQCLRRAGLVPGDYTAETFAAELTNSFRGSPFDPGSDAARACFAGVGLAYAGVQE